MGDGKNGDGLGSDFVDDAVVAVAKAIAWPAGEFFGVGRMGVGLKSFNFGFDN